MLSREAGVFCKKTRAASNGSTGWPVIGTKTVTAVTAKATTRMTTATCNCWMPTSVACWAPPAPPKFRLEIPIAFNNRVVGFLTYPDQEAIRDKLDQRFMGRQLRFVVWMLCVGTGLSLLVSWLLAPPPGGPDSGTQSLHP